MSPLVSCLLGLKLVALSGSKCDLRNMPKKATRHIAQNDASKLEVKSREACNRVNIEIVIGCFWLGGEPFARLMPVSRDCNGQLFNNGLGRPNSLCKIPIMLR